MRNDIYIYYSDQQEINEEKIVELISRVCDFDKVHCFASQYVNDNELQFYCDKWRNDLAVRRICERYAGSLVR